MKEVFVAIPVFLRVLHDGRGGQHRLIRPGPLLGAAACLQLVQLGLEGPDTRFGPGLFRGEGLFVDRQEDLRLFLVFHGFVQVGFCLLQTGEKLRRVQLGEDLVLGDGLTLPHRDALYAAADLKGQMGLRGLDRPGVVEFALPGVALSEIDEKPDAE